MLLERPLRLVQLWNFLYNPQQIHDYGTAVRKFNSVSFFKNSAFVPGNPFHIFCSTLLRIGVHKQTVLSYMLSC